MRASEIRTMSVPEIEVKIEDSFRELFILRQKKVTSHLENVKLISKLKREIARLKTIASEKRAAGAKS